MAETLDGQRQRWDARYRGLTPAPRPAAVLRHFAHLVPTTGSAVDLACGLGGNALWLAQRGLDVRAWDLSAVAIDQLRAAAAQLRLPVAAEARDLIAHPPESGRFDVIAVVRFLDRDLAPKIVAALRPGGLLFYETFTRESVDGRGPRDPAFRLAPNELLDLFRGLVVRGYREEGRLADPASGLGDLALMVAEKAR
ncbi:class I SAM-dependent methyltransferase [Thiocystis violacea]|uniref:class I SAM-dependent methyltransferase n=1 Tax=Thiocystis violacea TaxID=13725 RepID=UPI001907D348|nr:methyltransferase domain-containing protein [Thiocystis violacea]MBK1717321.1 SAM-dependent methyltransferase [Thiocystis violacea]